MLNVLRMELNRFFKGKAIYVFIAIIMAIPVIEYTSMKILIQNGIFPQDVVDKYMAYSSQQMVYYFWRQLFNGGALFFISVMMVSFILTEDYVNGTMKYSLMAVSRTELAVGKMLAVLILNSAIFCLGLLSGVTIAVITRSWDITGDTGSHFIIIAILAILTLAAFNSILSFIQVYINHLGAAIGIGLGLYVFSYTILQLLPESFTNYMFLGGIMRMSELHGSELTSAIIVPLVYTLIFSSLAGISLKRKAFLL